MTRDELYIIDFCDRVLNLSATRQKRFPFLRGDPGKNDRCAMLPVDAYYEQLNLAIEYQEPQHTKPNAFFDLKLTVSGCKRGEQRRLYDNRRLKILPEHGIRVVVLNYDLFKHHSSGRLKRNTVEDEAVIRGAFPNFCQ